MIRIENVTQYYGAFAALRDVSLEVQSGELLAVMGPNGSGKSTLLQVAAGLLWPLEGYVEINGLRRRSTAENELAIRQQVVYLPAEAWLPQTSSIDEFLIAVGRIYGHDDKRLIDHSARLLKLFNLDKIAGLPIKYCSTGQAKKVALCSAFIAEAPIMILDEPFSGGLDPSGIARSSQSCSSIWRSEATLRYLMATPVPDIVEPLAHRVAVIEDRTDQRSRFACRTASRDARRRAPFKMRSSSSSIPQTLDHVNDYFEEWESMSLWRQFKLLYPWSSWTLMPLLAALCLLDDRLAACGTAQSTLYESGALIGSALVRSL
jgi:ABC-2 type transport system ATP-binding protein